MSAWTVGAWGQVTWDGGADFAEAFSVAVIQPGFDIEHDFFNGGQDGVVLAFSAEVRAGGDEVNSDAEGGAEFVSALEADAGFVDLEARSQGEDAFLDEGVERVGGSQVEMFDSESHDGGGGVNGD